MERTDMFLTREGSGPLLRISFLFRAGSAYDPPGKEGLAYLTAKMLIEGGFGRKDNPITKEKLAELVYPYGSSAYPSIRVHKETTVVTVTIPRETLNTYLHNILGPMLHHPLFLDKELERMKKDTKQELRSLRFEQIELLGLVALDSFIHEGTSYAHPVLGTDSGIDSITRDDVIKFFKTYYTRDTVQVAVDTTKSHVLKKLGHIIEELPEGHPGLPSHVKPPHPVQGRKVLILAMPNAIATGIHIGYPIPLTRKDPDYWPLYVANVWFGTHRDSFSHLYQVIRAARGYNYGDYSYIEHFEGRPFYLFPPTNTPRRYQYFSIWIRPVDHRYAAHILRAALWELEAFIRKGLNEEQCQLARKKAEVLYLSLAETKTRLLTSMLDDAFYGLKPGYLDRYLDEVKKVTCEDMNRVIRKYLQTKNLKIIFITDDEQTQDLIQMITTSDPVYGKSLEDYHIDIVKDDGMVYYKVPDKKLDLIYQDGAWAHYFLDIKPEDILVIPSEKAFTTAHWIK